MITAPTSRKLINQGMNWIRPVKRLAIYLRDGMACAYCGLSVEDGAKLTLDHLKPYSKGGSNQEGNLVTCCSRCNSSRGNRSWKVFASTAAAYVNNGTDVVAFIEKARRRVLNLNAAKELMEQRGGFSAALVTKVS